MFYVFKNKKQKIVSSYQTYFPIFCSREQKILLKNNYQTGFSFFTTIQFHILTFINAKQ